jgi:hypothetical protein
MMSSKSRGWGRVPGTISAVLLAGLVAGCGGGDYSAKPETELEQASGPLRKRTNTTGLLFGEELSFNNLGNSGLFGSSADVPGDALPVNRFLWQASLDTLSFLPLASTDPFTGVIATEWSATPETPDERFKVTVYLVSAALEASSLRVAVYREALSEGVWIAQPVNPATAVQLENAILTRARQIRIAARDEGSTG